MIAGFLLLTACAAHPGIRAPVPVAERTAAPKGMLIAGSLVAIRPADSATLPASSAQVLAALQVAPPPAPANVTEFVIQQSDGSISAIALPSPAASPDASLSASDFAVGDHVELITGNRTELIHGTP